MDASARKQLQDTCALWVEATRKFTQAEEDFKDAQSTLEGSRGRVNELVATIKDRAQLGATLPRVIVRVPAARCGFVMVEMGRVVEMAENEVIGMEPEPVRVEKAAVTA